MLYTNVDGLNAIKGSELSILMQLEDPDVVFIVETKLDDQDITSQYLTCNGYRIYRKDRNGHAGGVLLIDSTSRLFLVNTKSSSDGLSSPLQRVNAAMCWYRKQS